MVTLKADIEFRNGTTTALEASTKICRVGEPIWDSTAKVLKIGDGVNVWSALDAITAGGVTSVFFYPETYGAVGDGVADDRIPLQAAIDAAQLVGGGTTIFSKRYGWTGDLFHRGANTVMGVSRRKVLVTDDNMDRGLVALDATARYRYGEWAGTPFSTNDNPGPLVNLVIDGNLVGGLNDLLLMECVDGVIENCNIVRSAGHALQVGGSQNSSINNCLIGLSIGSSVDFMRAGGQSAGNIKFNDCYIANSAMHLTTDSDPAQYWPHDIFFTQCLFENYDAGKGLVHMKAGDIYYTKCVFTNSNDGDPAPTNNCLILVEQTAWPTIPTQATFDGCYFNGSIGLDHLVRTVTAPSGVGNYIRFYGKNYFIGADAVVCLDGGGAFTSQVTIDGDPFKTGGGGLTNPEWYVAINGAWMHNIQRRTPMPTRWEIPDDPGGFLPNPIVTKRKGDANDRFRIDRDGFHRWFDGTAVNAFASLNSDAVNSRMQAGGIWQFTNGIEKRGIVTTVSAPATAVALSSSLTAAPYQLIYFSVNGATADVTISGGNVGAEVQIGMLGTGTNSATWSSDFKFQGGVAPVPQAGVYTYFTIKKELDGFWHEFSRSSPHAAVAASGATSATTATVAGTAAKTATVSGYTPAAGDLVALTLTNGNVVAAPTLSINGGTAYAIFQGGSAATLASVFVGANAVILLRFSGTRYDMLGVAANFDAATQAQAEAGTSTTAMWFTPQRVKQAATKTAARFVAWAKVPDSIITGSITRNAQDVITSAAVVWPDGATGTFTTDTIGTLDTIDAYHITYSDGTSSLTYTQPTITRNANGAATNVPAIVVT